jgi:hypothetical protein
MPNKKKPKPKTKTKTGTSPRGRSQVRPSTGTESSSRKKAAKVKTSLAATVESIDDLSPVDNDNNKGQHEGSSVYTPPGPRVVPVRIPIPKKDEPGSQHERGEASKKYEESKSQRPEDFYKHGTAVGKSGAIHEDDDASVVNDWIQDLMRTEAKGKAPIPRECSLQKEVQDRKPEVTIECPHACCNCHHYRRTGPTLDSVATKIHDPSMLFIAGNQTQPVTTRFVINGSNQDLPIVPFIMEFTINFSSGTDSMAQSDWAEFFSDMLTHMATSQLPEAQFQDLVFLCGNSVEHATVVAQFFRNMVSVSLNGNPQLLELEKLAVSLSRLLKECSDRLFGANVTLYAVRYVTRLLGVNGDRNYSLEKEAKAVSESERLYVENIVYNLMSL